MLLINRTSSLILKRQLIIPIYIHLYSNIGIWPAKQGCSSFNYLKLVVTESLKISFSPKSTFDQNSTVGSNGK
jgi:hypothetical protein